MSKEILIYEDPAQKIIRHKRKKSKVFRLSFLLSFLFILFFGTSISFSYWDNNLNPINNYDINVGVGTNLIVETTVVPSANEQLVPEDVFMGTGDVTEVIIVYNTTINKIGAISVASSNLLVNNNEDIYNLVNLDIYTETPNDLPHNLLYVILTEDDLTAQGYSKTIYVRLTLNMPETETEYNFIKGAGISFNLYFEASECPEE